MERKTNINIAQFLENNKLEDLTMEGYFHPKKDLTPAAQEGARVHYDIEGHPAWGVTYPTSLPDFIAAHRRGELFGYFHKHGEERVYLQPHHGLVPCLECKVAIKGC